MSLYVWVCPSYYWSQYLTEVSCEFDFSLFHLFPPCNGSWALPHPSFPWQLHPILWQHTKPARPMNGPLPSPPDPRSCGSSLNPMKGTVPEASRCLMWPMTVSSVVPRLQSVEAASSLRTEPTSGPAGRLLTSTHAPRGRQGMEKGHCWLTVAKF